MSVVLKKFHLILCITSCRIFVRNLLGLKMLVHKQKNNEGLKAKVLDQAGDIFNKLQYIYKERYKEQKDALNTKDTKKFDYTKLRLADDYMYESEEEDK